MLSGKRNLSAIIVLAVIILASVLLSAGCDMIKFTDYECNFKDNLPNGEGELFDPFNGKEPKAGKWTTAKKNGQWYSTSDNGLSFYPLAPGE